MTGKEKMAAALSPAGSPELPAMFCYEGIYMRDHWDAVTGAPWWDGQSYDLDVQMGWQRTYRARTPGDTFQVTGFPPRVVREATRLEERPDGVYRVDRRDGSETKLAPPVIGGWDVEKFVPDAGRSDPPTTRDEIDALLRDVEPFDAEAFLAAGRGDLAAARIAEFGADAMPMGAVSSPLWRCYTSWGFEGLMLLVADRPELAEYACQRWLTDSLQQVRRCAAIGAEVMWIEECFTDLVSPSAYERLGLPLLIELVTEIRRLGMKSIYYYCGDPRDRWELLLAAGADALALEESKKGFIIDIDEVVDRAAGRCCVFGNLDAIGLLEHGSEEELRAEIARQIAAGRHNGGRFVMSTGSPITPGTPPERVKLYLDIAHDLGAEG